VGIYDASALFLDVNVAMNPLAGMKQFKKPNGVKIIDSTCDPFVFNQITRKSKKPKCVVFLMVDRLSQMVLDHHLSFCQIL
jgi:hypothetical protein|tara:strand:+ start:220 stop:462 length:243 start_codon:yes stop_codon:yes gene_type:complete